MSKNNRVAIIGRKEIFDKVESYEGMTLEDIEKVLKELERQPEDLRPFKAFVSCKTYGGRWVDMSSSWWCNNPECNVCFEFQEALKNLNTHKEKETDIENLKLVEEKKYTDFNEKNDPYERQQKRYRLRNYGKSKWR